VDPHVSFRESYNALVNGFSEPVEYVVTVNGQREARRAVRRYDGLLRQLAEQSTTPLPSRGQNGPGGGKAGSRPTMNMVYANAVDTIEENAWIAWELLCGPGYNSEWGLSLLLAHLYDHVKGYADERPDECATVARMARKWVHDARVLLGYESRKVTLADTVCGECGGTLVVAIDATSDVRCIGTASAEPCGMVYGRLEWVSLLS
jgi:hypothetical protein